MSTPQTSQSDQSIMGRTLRTMSDSILRSFNRGLVTAYKGAGFVLLTVILCGMFAYLSVSGFYLFSSRWVVPSILTPNNDKVVQAQWSWLNQRHELERIEAELVSYKTDLGTAQLAMSTWSEFGSAYESALGRETKKSRAKLAAVEGLVSVIESSDLAKNLGGPGTMAVIDQQLANGLIDIHEHSRLKAQANKMALEEAERREKVLGLKDRAAGLRGLIATGTGTDVETLLRYKPLIDSKLETAHQTARESGLKSRIDKLESLVIEYRATLERMQDNPYVRAAQTEMQVAFVPYTNLSRVESGTRIFSCALEFVFCKEVGEIKGVVGGEVVGNHPITGRDLRGRMVEMTLKSSEMAEARSLILRRPPFFF